MLVHLYICPSGRDDEPLLTYDSKVVVDGDMTTQLPLAVVRHYIERILHRKEVPYMIEEDFEMRFQTEQMGGGGGGGGGDDGFGGQHIQYLSEMSLTDYHEMLKRIARNEATCNELFYHWTEMCDHSDTLVCVAESDLAAPFIKHLYPPVEFYTRTVTGASASGGGGGRGGGDDEEEEEEE